MSTLNRIARALHVPTSSLIGNAARSAARSEPDHDEIALLELRRTLTPARGLRGAVVGGPELEPPTPDDVRGAVVGGPELEPPTPDDVRGAVRTLDRAYHADYYATTMAGLPLLIAEARTAVDETTGDDQAAALQLMAQTYQLAGTTLIQLRAFDLAHRALSSALDAADDSEDDVIGASAVTTMCWLLLRQGRFDETEQLAVANLCQEAGHESGAGSAGRPCRYRRLIRRGRTPRTSFRGGAPHVVGDAPSLSVQRR
jgi:hypothetical protein